MMNVKEVARLIDWLTAKGLSSEEVNECIRYIAESPSVNEGKEKGSGAPGK